MEATAGDIVPYSSIVHRPPFSIEKAQGSDFSLHNSQITATFAGNTGLLKSVTTKQDGVQHRTNLEFVQYGTVAGHEKSGAYLFLPDGKAKENRVVQLESDFVQNQSDLKLAFKRIADLQAALEEDLDSDEDLSDSDELDDDESDIDTFLSTHKQSPLFRRRGSLDSDTRSRITSSSSGLTDTPSSPRFANNFDISEA